MSEQELQKILEQDVNLYEVLEVKASAAASQIRRSYRQKALLYHPDKNPSLNAKDKFEQISVALRVLTNDDLKVKYDDILRQREVEDAKNRQLSEKEQKLKQDLLNAEREYVRKREKAKQRARKIDILREEGLRLRRAKEHETKSRKSNLFQVEPASHGLTEFPLTVRLKWKSKPELESLITPDVIKDLMSVFGSVKQVYLVEKEKKYNFSIVEFESFVSVARAAIHDYTHPSSIWDEMRLGKMASLLRSCHVYSSENDAVEENLKNAKIIADVSQISAEEYIGLTLLRLDAYQGDKNG